MIFALPYSRILTVCRLLSVPRTEMSVTVLLYGDQFVKVHPFQALRREVPGDSRRGHHLILTFDLSEHISRKVCNIYKNKADFY